MKFLAKGLTVFSLLTALVITSPTLSPDNIQAGTKVVQYSHEWGT